MRTIQDIHDAVDAIIVARRVKAQASPYDWKVCVAAVGAAARCFEAVPRTGAPQAYLQSVTAALDALTDSYNDPDGEFTSGASEIGSIVTEIKWLKLDDPSDSQAQG